MLYGKFQAELFHNSWNDWSFSCEKNLISKMTLENSQVLQKRSNVQFDYFWRRYATLSVFFDFFLKTLLDGKFSARSLHISSNWISFSCQKHDISKMPLESLYLLQKGTNVEFDQFWRRFDFLSVFFEFSMENQVIWRIFTQIAPQLQELEVIFMPKT